MTISAVAKTNSLLTDLTAKGLSSAKAKLVASDLDASVKSAGGSGTALDKAAVRTALNQRIQADVASGKLTQKDADAVTKTLDGMADKVADASTAAPSSTSSAGGTAQASATGGAAPAGAAGGGGGGGGSAAKTELSRVVVVSGALETTTITYTDGSTETTTGASDGDAATDASATSAASPTSAASTASSKVDGSAYTTKVSPGSLIDTFG